MEQRRIPDIIGPQTLVTLTPRDCAHDAAQLMTTHRISAILVVEGDCLVGICTERDIVTRVVAADCNPPTTPLAAVMTADHDCVTPDATLAEAWDRMSRGGYRHLPVVADGSAVGIVSVRDLHAAVMAGLQADLEERDAFIAGIGPGGLN